MNKLQGILDNLRQRWEASAPVREKIKNVFSVIGKIFREIFRSIYLLRGLFLAVPVALVALRLAAFNRENLPEMVGIDLQANGQYTYLLDRETVILWPLIITGGCLALMLLSRRTIYPWVISIFSLVIPILIYVTNIFPA